MQAVEMSLALAEACVLRAVARAGDDGSVRRVEPDHGEETADRARRRFE